MPIEEVSSELLERAMKPRLEFGRSILPEKSLNWGLYMMITVPEVWGKVKDMLINPPQHVYFVETMDRQAVEIEELKLPVAASIVGVGGGMALDMAKYVGWRRDMDPVLVPSIASVDACVTNTVAVREAGRVRYIGFVVPQVVVSDFELITSAPPEFNRAGIGDILSIHTGCFDWKLAADSGRGEYDEDVADKVKNLVDELEERAESIAALEDDAIKWLIEAYAAENELCLKVGHSRPEEGSEHFFAYNVEARTGKKFVHGELVCLGITIMTRLQGNTPDRARNIMDKAGVRYHPRDLGLTREEVIGSLTSLLRYVAMENLPYSIINEQAIDEALAKELIDGLEF